MKIFDLTAPFVTPRNVVLPAYDSYGMPHGDLHSAFHKARTPMNSTRSTFANLKSDRRVEAISTNEQRVLYALMFHPYVIDFREQYAFCDDDALVGARRKGNRMLRTNMTTLDVVATYVTPGHPIPRYHAISVKGPFHVPTEKDIRRERRERFYLEKLGWTSETLRGDEITDAHYFSCRNLYRMVRNTNVWSLYDDAGAFSKMLLNGSRKGAAATVVGRAARRFGVTPDDGYRLFAAAVAFGFLQLERTALFDFDRPIILQGDDGWKKRPASACAMRILQGQAWR
ncbi:hypothetical protein [Ralstonia pseudosolanacearum]|uniref:hypothetical protein n=1 Tax=Ralstonia pseudosolanacearum TaxID=1310165 RepID=UPI00339693B1